MWISRAFSKLAGRLPPRAAQRVGRSRGHLTYQLLAGRRRRAQENLELGLSDLEAMDRTAMLRRAYALHGAAAVADTAIRRYDAVALCRRLSLEGWGRLDPGLNDSAQHDRARQRGTGFLAVVFAGSHWQLATLALGLYRGSVTATTAMLKDNDFSHWAAKLAKSTGQAVVEPVEPSPGSLAERLRQGACVVCRLDPAAVASDSVSVPLFGRSKSFAPLIAEASLAAEAPIVPVYSWPHLHRPGGYRIVVDTPLVAATSGEDVEKLIRTCCECLEQEVGRQPEVWPWWQIV